MKNTPIRVLKLTGTPYEIGRQHGQAYTQAIQRYTHERVSLVQSGTWSGGHVLSREQVLDLADRALYRAKEAGRNYWIGVFSAPEADLEVLRRRKEDELDVLAHDGILELHTPESDTAVHADAQVDDSQEVAPTQLSSLTE